MPMNYPINMNDINPQHTQAPQSTKPRMTLEESDAMRGPQGNVPRPTNNGNPRGAFNMPYRRGGRRVESQSENQNDGWYQDPTGRMTFYPPEQRHLMPRPTVPQPQGRFNNDYYAPGDPSRNPYMGFRGDANYYGGQALGTGRYRPPTMDTQGNWNDFGGYNYNLPNAFGSYPGYGQGNPYSPFFEQGYGGFFGLPPRGG